MLHSGTLSGKLSRAPSNKGDNPQEPGKISDTTCFPTGTVLLGWRYARGSSKTGTEPVAFPGAKN